MLSVLKFMKKKNEKKNCHRVERCICVGFCKRDKSKRFKL